MKIHYLSCFAPDDPAEVPLKTLLADWGSRANVEITNTTSQNAENCREHITSLAGMILDVLIIGGHGHDSLSGFLVREDPVRWHDLSVLLRATLSRNSTFIFYSCNGAFPGINPIFDQNFGPDFVFGPYIHVDSEAMSRAINEILAWKQNGGGGPTEACGLVDAVNEWANRTYYNPDQRSFLRVIWGVGRKVHRYPTKPSSDKFKKPLIALRGWGVRQGE